MMLLKQFSYNQYGCENQSVVVYIYSLNNVIMPSFHSSHSDPKLPNCANFANVTVYGCNHTPNPSI
jgi:hypothetical protein